jgi:hypothetical protein
MPCPATHPLPCVLPDTDGKAFAVPHEHCRVSSFFAVAVAFAMRRDRCRALWLLCRASALCRGTKRCRVVVVAVRPPAPFVVRPAASSHGKGPGSTPARSQDAQVCATWRLCRVYAHGKAPQYFLFFCFFNSLHFKIENTHICIYITSNTPNTCIYGCTYPQIHQTYQIHAYMHAYNMKYINTQEIGPNVHIEST